MKKLSLKLFAIGALAFFGMSALALPSVSAVSVNTDAFGDVTAAWDVWVAWAGTEQWDGLITIIKNLINWILGMLGLISLVILLWGGFQMVTARWNEEIYKKWCKILQQAAVGLAFIAISRFVVSAIFRLLWSVMN